MSSEAIINAILSQTKGDLIESPLRAPMSAGVRIGVTRDRKLVVLAVAREGLSELRSIGQAYRWVPPAALPAYDYPAADREVVARLSSSPDAEPKK